MSEAGAIIRRFWRAEADASAAVAGAARAAGDERAEVATLGDGVLVALGPGRYVNRAIGVGPELDRVEIVEVDDSNVEEWLEVLADGNEITTSEGRGISDDFGLAARAVSGSVDFLALIDGHAVGCGSLQVTAGVGLLGGAATRPGHRRRGVQGALLRHRIRLAAELGCDLVASTALPPGASARNLLRHGLNLVDTQLVMTAAPEGI